jgi:hypothetical protein
VMTPVLDCLLLAQPGRTQYPTVLC